MDFDLSFSIPSWVLLFGGGFLSGVIFALVIFFWLFFTVPTGGRYR